MSEETKRELPAFVGMVTSERTDLSSHDCVEVQLRLMTERDDAVTLLRDLYDSLSEAFGGEPFSPEWKTLMARLRAMVGKEDQ